ncbi:preprotein translocase subunit SecA [Lentisalinibacter orientalis]|uniref:preprotein translocase subunit SecA n=1 Tax=Lentisalinibacter orientalis TaxID=2992241 RepID=UPI0038678A78
MAFLTKIFGSRNERLVKSYSKLVNAINALEDEYRGKSDEELAAMTPAFRERLANGEKLDSLIPEAFAAVREAAGRTVGMRHFDVQLIGGLVLHEGKIAEMKTGEGKTLVATLPAYLNALTGEGVHIVTVNEYLASRDASWMGPVYNFLGLEVGVIRSGQSPAEKREAYGADITYATNNELGFDYLRDNLAFSTEDRAQRRLAYGIVDEVDSILIDEARTPLIISGPSEERTELYEKINKLVPKLQKQEEEEGPGDYLPDEKTKQVYLTEEGHQHVEELMTKAGLLQPGESLYDAGNIKLMHHLMAALRAHAMYQRDVDYIVKDGEIVIVDEFTGRTMPGRRWSDGLHQAVEAKEGVRVKEENQTIASITFQNFFRMYQKLAGMTGTADTEAFEFQSIYGLEVVVIPTHRPMVRADHPDLVFLNQNDKFEAIIEDIVDCRERGQPVLVGTTSIENSELLSDLLTKKKIPHQVLNAKQHEREAKVVEDAGRPGTITIATNMAGRGTDIVLGGNKDAELAELGEDATEDQRQAVIAEWQKRHDQVLEAGGLHIVGTERHESRRIDNQLRGRSGRQGDPGSSRFYLSMEDSLMRIFGDPNRTKSLLQRVGMRDGEAIESGLLSRQIEKAQRKVEAHNFDIRKSLLEYDDVANDQRKVVYHQRSELMEADDVAESVENIRDEVVETAVQEFIPRGSVEEQWDPEGLQQALRADFGLDLPVAQWLEKEKTLNADQLCDRIVESAKDYYEQKVAEIGDSIMRGFEKQVMLSQLDLHWKEHLAAMDYLRQGIHLRGYAQKNPKQEYKREAFEMFGQMLEQVKHDTISILMRVRLRSQEEVERMEAEQRAKKAMEFQHAQASALASGATAATASAAAAEAVAGGGGGGASAEPVQPFVREGRKIGRNEPCPCGSGKKYKQCHGRLS